MRDLLAIVPSRDRPADVAELIKTIRATARARTDLIVAFDDDDPQRGTYGRLRDRTRKDRRIMWATGPRKSLAGWTNRLAAAHAGRYRAVCSMGDDHRPRTDGWDVQLLAAALDGTGLAYGDDLFQRENLPTAVVISSAVVAALGWVCQPSLRHYFVDNVWKDLGALYVPGVVIEHLHYLATGAAPDDTYRQAETVQQADQAAYARWLRDGLAADADTVRGLLREEARTT